MHKQKEKLKIPFRIQEREHSESYLQGITYFFKSVYDETENLDALAERYKNLASKNGLTRVLSCRG